MLSSTHHGGVKFMEGLAAPATEPVDSGSDCWAGGISHKGLLKVQPEAQDGADEVRQLLS